MYMYMYVVREEYARATNVHVHSKRQNRSCFADDGLALFTQRDGQVTWHPKYICI